MRQLQTVGQLEREQKELELSKEGLFHAQQVFSFRLPNEVLQPILKESNSDMLALALAIATQSSAIPAHMVNRNYRLCQYLNFRIRIE